MYSSTLVTILVVFGILNKNVSCYNILCAYPTICPSHLLVVEVLTKGLAEKGHNVTVVTSFPSETTLKNYRQIYIHHPDYNKIIQFLLTYYTKNTGSLLNAYLSLPIIMDITANFHKNLLNEPNVQKIMRDEHFDLVIVENFFGNALLGLGAHFKCPTATFISFAPFLTMYKETGNPLSLSYNSHPFLNFQHPLSFRNKVLGVLLYAVDIFYLKRITDAKHRIGYKNFFPSPKYPTYDEMLKNVSINFVPTHFSEGSVRPLVPSIIEIGGIHINNKTNPLPDELQQWMDDSVNGVILFSLGSNMKSALLPEKLVVDLLNAFRVLKQNILWKFENDTLPDLPKNVRIQHWIPQNDLLQHRNTKLFITHAGLGSVTEAKFHGVPLILSPLFADQMANAQAVVNRGWGIQIPFVEMSGKRLTECINTILSNPKYANQAKYESTLYRDRLNTPLEIGIYWVEYVIRHHGAKHLKSNAVDLNFFQLYSLDVIGFLIIVTLTIVLVFGKLLSVSFSRLKKNLNKKKIE